MHEAIYEVFNQYGVISRHKRYFMRFFVFIRASNVFRSEVKQLLLAMIGKDLIFVQNQDDAEDRQNGNDDHALSAVLVSLHNKLYDKVRA